jgi:hypothetical protein
VTGIFLPGLDKKNNFLRLMGWLSFVLLFYLGMRLIAVKLKPGVPDTEILNNPYLLATGEERLCTKAFVLLKYLVLQCFPHPLSSDYSYNSIEYRHFSSWDFILSLILHLALVAGAVYLSLKKHPMGFAMMVYILFALMIGNVLMDIGATMGERLIFHSSIGFCMALAWILLQGFARLPRLTLPARRMALCSLVIITGFLFGCKTWERNFDWKNDVTLFLKDSQTMPNSVLCLGNAGARYVDLSNTSDFSDSASVKNTPLQGEYNGTLDDVEEEVRQGKYKTRREAVLNHGVQVLRHAIELHPRYVNGYLNLGLLYFHLNQDEEALYYWKNAERLYPNNPYLRGYYQSLGMRLRNQAAMAYQRQRLDSAAMAYTKLSLLEPGNPEHFYNLGGVYFNMRRYALAKQKWERALKLKPDYQEVKQVLPLVTPLVPAQPVKL